MKIQSVKKTNGGVTKSKPLSSVAHAVLTARRRSQEPTHDGAETRHRNKHFSLKQGWSLIKRFAELANLRDQTLQPFAHALVARQQRVPLLILANLTLKLAER